jgi:hypothetical protein
LFVAYRTEVSEAYAEGELNSTAAVEYISAGDNLSAYNCKVWKFENTTVGGFAYMHFYGPKTSDSTLLNADAFYYNYEPEGRDTGDIQIYVTYHLTKVLGVNAGDLRRVDFQYDPKVGYIVYKLELT